MCLIESLITYRQLKRNGHYQTLHELSLKQVRESASRVYACQCSTRSDLCFPFTCTALSHSLRNLSHLSLSPACLSLGACEPPLLCSLPSLLISRVMEAWLVFNGLGLHWAHFFVVPPQPQHKFFGHPSKSHRPAAAATHSSCCVAQGLRGCGVGRGVFRPFV